MKCLFLFFIFLLKSQTDWVSLADSYLNTNPKVLLINLTLLSQDENLANQIVQTATRYQDTIKTYPTFEIDKAIENAKLKDPSIIPILLQIKRRNQQQSKSMEEKKLNDLIHYRQTMINLITQLKH